MAWNEKALKELNRRRTAKARKLDRFDLEAEREGAAIKDAPGVIGPVGHRIAKIRRNHDRGSAIAERAATRNIEVGDA